MWRDPERTAAELARFSRRDAQAWQRLLEDWRAVAVLHLSRMAAVPGVADEHSPEAVAAWAALAAPSAWEAIHQRFESPQARSLLLWISGITTQPVRRPGTGLLPISLAGMMGEVSWTNAIGGAGALTDALIGAIEADGGRVLSGHRVERVLVEGGRAVAVLTTLGERFDAGDAVLSSAHVLDLQRLLGPARLPAAFDALDRWRLGPSMFVVHLAIEGVPSFSGARGPEPSVLAGFGTPDGIAAQANDLDAGRLSGDDLWLLGACSSIADPTRAPAAHSTVKILTAAPYAPNGDADRWERLKDDYAERLVRTYVGAATGLDAAHELARAVHTPVDLERRNPHNHKGSHQGGEMTPDQMGPNRPVAGWAGYRMPIAGLYQTGSTTHPGGGVTGFPGRNAARVILDDLGLGASAVMDVAGAGARR